MTVLYLKRCDSQMWLTKHYMCVITVSYLIIFNNIKMKIAFFLSLFHESLVTANKWHSITEKSQGKTNNERKKQTMLSCVAHKVFSVNVCGLCFQFRNESLENGKKTTWPSKKLPQQIQPRIFAFVWWNAKKILVIPKIDMHLACSWWETWSFLEEKTGNITFKVHIQLSYWQHLK